MHTQTGGHSFLGTRAHTRTHTHTHTLAPSLEVISCSAGCTLLARWLLGHTGFAQSHGTAAEREKQGQKGAFRRLSAAQGHSSSSCFSGELGRAQSKLNGPRYLGTRLLLGCQRVPEHWPSGVLTWTSCPPRTLWASSAPCLRAAEEGEKATDSHLRPWVTLAQI